VCWLHAFSFPAGIETAVKPLLIICVLAILIASAKECAAYTTIETIQSDASGQSFGFSLFGIIPVTTPNRAIAKAKLYQSVKIPLIGKEVSLSHERWVDSCTYLVLFSITRVTVTADVVQVIVHPAHSINEI
jgi:hypothetical protein